jgi:cobalamin biosynthesis protein CobD/CbiB
VNGDSLIKEFGNVMTNISQNVTKVKEEMKAVAIGAAVLAPVVGIVYLFSLLVNNGYLNEATLANIFLVASGFAACWTVGGAVQAANKWREMKRAEKERKTQKAFEKLSNGNT